MPQELPLIPPEQFSAVEYARRFDDPKITSHKILSSFPSDTARRIESVHRKLEKVTETIIRYKAGGQYLSDRVELHKTIIENYLSEDRISQATPDEGDRPTFIILGGRGGSGKSWFRNNIYDPSKTIVLDSDEIKEKLPEYEGWNAYEVHEESGEIFDLITDQAQRMGLNITHDATMKTPRKAVQLVRRFKGADYRIEVHYMFLPRQEAAKRAIARFLGKDGRKAGRYVPIEVVLGNTSNEISFDRVKELVDCWSFWDNNVLAPKDPCLIAENTNGLAQG